MQRMLVADDDAAIRSILRDFLEDEGYDVDETESGAGVLAALGSKDGNVPDLVLMDIRMPDKGGLDVLRELAAGKKHPAPPHNPQPFDPGAQQRVENDRRDVGQGQHHRHHHHRLRDERQTGQPQLHSVPPVEEAVHPARLCARSPVQTPGLFR